MLRRNRGTAIAFDDHSQSRLQENFKLYLKTYLPNSCKTSGTNTRLRAVKTR